MTKDPAPRKILAAISCGCKTGCGKACGWRKSGLSCTIACKVCEGSKCTNNSYNYVDEHDDDDDVDGELDDDIDANVLGDDSDVNDVTDDESGADEIANDDYLVNEDDW